MKRVFLFSQVSLPTFIDGQTGNCQISEGGLWASARAGGSPESENSPPPAIIHPLRGGPDSWSLAEPAQKPIEDNGVHIPGSRLRAHSEIATEEAGLSSFSRGRIPANHPPEEGSLGKRGGFPFSLNRDIK